MNAAARLVHQSALSRHLVFTYALTRKQFAMVLLIMSVLFSAIGIVYVTHMTRIVNANYQRNLLEVNRLHIEKSRLLLEESALVMQARVQQQAENELGMIIPEYKSIVVVHE